MHRHSVTIVAGWDGPSPAIDAEWGKGGSMNGNDASSWLAAALALTVLAGASFALAQAPQPAAHSKVLIQVSDAGTAN